METENSLTRGSRRLSPSDDQLHDAIRIDVLQQSNCTHQDIECHQSAKLVGVQSPRRIAISRDLGVIGALKFANVIFKLLCTC